VNADVSINHIVNFLSASLWYFRNLTTCRAGKLPAGRMQVGDALSLVTVCPTQVFTLGWGIWYHPQWTPSYRTRNGMSDTKRRRPTSTLSTS